MTKTPTASSTPTTVPPSCGQYADDTDLRVVFDGWVGTLDPNAKGGSIRYSGKAGAVLSFRFYSSAVTLHTQKRTDGGKAQVLLDGRIKQNLALYGNNTNASFTWGKLNLKSHLITVKAIGQPVPGSTGTIVVVDAFQVGTALTQDTAKAIQLGQWKSAGNTNAANKSFRVSNVKNSKASFTFCGTGVNWITTKGPGYGKADVYIDGVLVRTVDLYNKTLKWQVAQSFTGLASGMHTIEVRVKGMKNLRASSTKVIVDAFQVSQ